MPSVGSISTTIRDELGQLRTKAPDLSGVIDQMRAAVDHVGLPNLVMGISSRAVLKLRISAEVVVQIDGMDVGGLGAKQEVSWKPGDAAPVIGIPVPILQLGPQT